MAISIQWNFVRHSEDLHSNSSYAFFQVVGGLDIHKKMVVDV